MAKQNVLKNATIRNARLCRESENYAHYFVFDKERDLKGWNVVEDGTLYGVSGGYYFLSVFGNNPSLSRSDNFGAVDASIYTEVVVRYKFIKNRTDSDATQGKIQFTTTSDSGFDDVKSVLFDVNPDGNWHIYKINMGPVSSWVGNIVNLKIFFGLGAQSSDEVLISYIKIQQPTFLFCTEDCYQDNSITVVGENLDIETIGAEPQNFSLSEVSPTKIVSIQRDPISISNQTLLLSNTLGTSSGPKATRFLSTPVTTGFFSIRLYVSGYGSSIKLKQDVLLDLDIINLKIDTDGRLKYKNGPSFLDLTDPTTILQNTWNDLLITFNGDTYLFDISVNGLSVGRDLPYLLTGQITGLEFYNSNSSIASFYLDDIILVSQEETSTICPGIGRQGEAEGTDILFSQVDIIEGVNDSILVNLNGFGDVKIVLDPRNGMTPYELRDALEEKISTLDLGGYPYCEVLFFNNRFIIKSGTYGFDSTVEIKKDGTSSLAEDLGFYIGDTPIYSSKTGRPHSNNFKFTNTYRAKSSDLLTLKSNRDNEFNLLHDPTDFLVEAGSRFAAETGRKNKVSGNNKTIIDFYHRASEEGLLTKAYFHGVLPKVITTKLTGNQGQVVNNLFNTGFTSLNSYSIVSGDLLIIDSPGYDSNGTYVVDVISDTGGLVKIKGNKTLTPGTNLSFSIQTYVKIKHFRPKLDGTLDLINEVQIGNRTAGQVYTNSPDSFSADINWYAHRGDLFGIYNASSIYVGNDANGNPDALYLEEEGDLIGASIKVGEPIGQGIKGIGLFLQNEEAQTKAAYDILFDSPVLIQNVSVIGKQAEEKRYYNLGAAIGNGFGVSATVTGTHNHRVETGSGPATITHNNISYNLHALTDGVKYASNGLLVNFEQNNSSAVYFYISGDGEFAFYDIDDGGNLVENSLEFPITPDGNGGFNGTFSYFISDYKDDAFDLRFTWNVRKKIDRFKIYFKEFPNAKTHFLQWLKKAGDVFDGDLPGYEKIGLGNTSQFTKVLLNGLLIEPGTTAASAFQQHLLTTFDTNPNKGGENTSNDLYYSIYYPYTILDKYFDPVETTSLIWKCLYHDSTKISEVEVYSSTQSATSLETAVEFYFSSDGEFFQRIDPEISDDGNLRFDIGFPVKAARLVVEPETKLFLDKIKFSPIDTFIKYQDSVSQQISTAVNVKPVFGGMSEPEKLIITNKTGEIADVELSISTEELFEDILIKTSLESAAVINSPEIGPPGFLYLDSDYDLAVTKNVAINASTYGLKNLAIDKKYYLGISQTSPTDYMVSGIDLTKWGIVPVNFPKASPNGLEAFTTSGGFGMKLFDITHGGPKDSISHEYKAVASWNITGAFSASLVGEHNMTRGSANSAGTRLSIQDGTGRTISIEKNRVRYSFGSINRDRNWSEYVIRDSLLGTLHTHMNFCATPARCGSLFGTIDDNVEYVVTITRIVSPNFDVLRLSYIDPVNGSNTGQFANEPYIEIDLTTLATPLVGPLKAVISTFWSDTATNNATTDTPTSAFNYVKINKFLFGGNSTFETSYVFEDNYKYVGISGSIQENNIESSIGFPVKLVALDLERRFSLDIFDIWSPSGSLLWSRFNVLFSNSEVTDPDQVVWGNSDTFDVRWILFIEEAVPYTTTSGLIYLDHVRIYPEITRLAPEQTTNSEWISLGNVLTDGNYSTNSQVLNIDYPTVVVKLANHFSLSNFKALDSSGREFPKNDTYSLYQGWTLHSEFSLSSSLTEDPKQVSWDTWQEYSSEFKNLRDIKWIALKSSEFNLSAPRHVSEIVATTRGVRGDDIGQVKDLVDLTEYSEWFSIKYSYDKNIALLEDEDEFQLEGTLFGSSIQRTTISGELSPTFSAFDDDDTTQVYLVGTPSNLWRVFGDVTEVISGSETAISGTDGNVIIISGTNSSYIVEPREENISGFYLNVAGDSKSIPNTIAIQKLTGTDPTSDASWTTITTETNLATAVTVDEDLNSEEYVFNSGEPYVYRFNPAITTSGLRISITASVDFTPEDRTAAISEFKIFKSIDQTVDPTVIISNDSDNRVGGRRSLKVTYLEGNSNSVLLELPASFSVGPDPLWSIQDFLSFYYQLDSGLDLSSSYLRFGKDSDHFYEWNLSSLITSSGFSKAHFRFKDATSVNKIGFNYGSDTAEDRLTQLDFTSQEFTFLQLELKPSGTSPVDVNFWLDNFDLTRESFSISGLNNTPALYLNNSELVYFPISDFDIRKGFFESTIIPDWNSEGITDIREEKVFTLFSALNSLNESFSCYYSERYGLVFIAYSYVTQERHRFYCGRVPQITQYKPFKLSVAWDSQGGAISGPGITLRVWINDSLFKDFVEPWDIQKTKDSYFFLGSRAYQNDVAISGTYDYPRFIDDVILVPTTRSITGGVQNFILAKTPKKLYFENIQHLKDKIYLSIDGINYYNGISPTLPITIYNVDPDESIEVWIKVNLPSNTKNLSRTGYLRTRWRLVV